MIYIAYMNSFQVAIFLLVSWKKTWKLFDLRATNIYDTLKNSRFFAYGIISSEGDSKFRFLISESSNENTALC